MVFQALVGRCPTRGLGFARSPTGSLVDVAAGPACAGLLRARQGCSLVGSSPSSRCVPKAVTSRPSSPCWVASVLVSGAKPSLPVRGQGTLVLHGDPRAGLCWCSGACPRQGLVEDGVFLCFLDPKVLLVADESWSCSWVCAFLGGTSGHMGLSLVSAQPTDPLQGILKATSPLPS